LRGIGHLALLERTFFRLMFETASEFDAGI